MNVEEDAALIGADYHDEDIAVYIGDARQVLSELPAESVDCCVTSPPYWALRDYDLPPSVWGGDPACRHVWAVAPEGLRCRRCRAWRGCLGLEPTPDLYVAHLVEVFGELRRVLKPTGVLWLVLGDTYATGARPHAGVAGVLKPKDLIGIPWRVALALQADGWYLRSGIVWHKPSILPEPARDRPTSAHEFVFLCSKEPRYFFDLEAIKEPAIRALHSRRGGGPSSWASKYASVGDPRVKTATGFGRQSAPIHSDRRHPRDVWTIPVQPYHGLHTATFPARLVERCILAGSSSGGCCASCGRPRVPILRSVDAPGGERGRSRSAHRRSAHHRATFDPKLVRATSTTGWRPSCECDAGTVPAVVLDCFAGSGTTVAVARRLGRRGLAIERNPDFLTEIVRRRADLPPSPEATTTSKGGSHHG